MQTIQTSLIQQPWTRSESGILAGVCQGMGERFEVDPWIIRVLWILSVLGLGFGFLLYGILVIALPKENHQQQAQQKRILGVCARLSRSLEVDVGLLRAGALLIALSSLGTTILVYLVLHFVTQGSQELRHITASSPAKQH